MTEKLKKKPRMTCKQYCPVWNDIDKDCELYGEHHLTPRTCPHYNLEILEKKMIEKFIEENHDTQNTKDEQLTEQWKKGELPEGYYYVRDGENMIAEYLDGYFYNNGEPMTSFTGGVDEVLAPVPSYEVYKELIDGRKLLREYIKDKTNENAQLKELLKACSIANTALISIMDWLQSSVISEQKEHCKKLFENTQELQKQIDEVLK